MKDLRVANSRSRSGAVWIIVPVLLLQACASPSLWRAKSPDRRRIVEIRDAGSARKVVLDGREIGRHDGVGVATFAFSGDGRHWAYSARNGGNWMVRSSRGDSRDWEGIGGIWFSPSGDRMAFAGERGGKWTVTVDGRTGQAWEALLQDTFAFSPDGRRFAFAAQRGGKTFAVLDEAPGPGFDGVGKLVFGASGGLAYTARIGDSAYAVAAGAAGPAYDAITELILNPVTGAPAYLARKDREWHVVIEGRESPAYQGARNLVFSGDGRGAAWIVRTGNWEFVAGSDGREAGPFSAVRDGTLGFGSDPAKPSYLAVTLGGKEVLVRDGLPGPEFDEISIALSGMAGGPPGKSWGYAGRTGPGWIVMIDGKEHAREKWAGPPVFGPGGRIAYAARRPQGMAAVVDGRRHLFELLLEDTIMFGVDGLSWGCVAAAAGDRGLSFFIDGEKSAPVDIREVAGLALQGPRDGGGAALGEWMAAELELRRRP